MNRTTSFWLAAFPVVLTIGVLTIPVVANYADHEMASNAARLVSRWYWGHLVSALGFAVGAVAAGILLGDIVRRDRDRGDPWAFALVVVGAALHIYGLGGDGIGPIAVLAAGGEPASYFDGLGLRLSGVFMAGAATFCLGWLRLTGAAIKIGAVTGRLRWWLPAGIILMALAEASPSGWGLYVVAALALAVWLPLSRAVARIPAGAQERMVHVREEGIGDRAAIRHVNQEAFGTSVEADLVDRLRTNCEAVVSLVAVENDNVIGHLLFSPVTNELSGDQAMALGPMAVLPERQKRGIGSELVQRGLTMVRERDCPFVVVLGHAEYYPRFGFVPASRFGLRCQWAGVPDEAFMVIELKPHGLRGVHGIVRYRNEFDDAM